MSEVKGSRVLVVYYSLEGHCKLIAEHMAARHGFHTLALEPVKDLDPDSSSKHVVGRLQILFNQRVALKRLPESLEDYDLVIIGSPVWMGTAAPAIMSLLEGIERGSVVLGDKAIALFSTYDKDAGQLFERVKEKVNAQVKGEAKANANAKANARVKVIGEISFDIKAMSQAQILERIDNWICSMLDA